MLVDELLVLVKTAIFSRNSGTLHRLNTCGKYIRKILSGNEQYQNIAIIYHLV